MLSPRCWEAGVQRTSRSPHVQPGTWPLEVPLTVEIRGLHGILAPQQACGGPGITPISLLGKLRPKSEVTCARLMGMDSRTASQHLSGPTWARPAASQPESTSIPLLQLCLAQQPRALDPSTGSHWPSPPTVLDPPCRPLLHQLPHDHHHAVAAQRRWRARVQCLRALHQAARGEWGRVDGERLRAAGPELGTGIPSWVT